MVIIAFPENYPIYTYSFLIVITQYAKHYSIFYCWTGSHYRIIIVGLIISRSTSIMGNQTVRNQTDFKHFHSYLIIFQVISQFMIDHSFQHSEPMVYFLGVLVFKF